MLAVILHEVSHGYAALKLGDPTAKMMGRLTLNPLSHIDIFGTIILPLLLLVTTGFVLGYAKPVPINPFNFKNPKRDMAISSAAGPITNLLLALISVLLLHHFLVPLFRAVPENVAMTIIRPLGQMLDVSISINIILAVFNMIPIPPLDGGRVLTGMLSHKHAASFSKIEPFGFIIIIALLMTGVLGKIVSPIIKIVEDVLRAL
jgi:Zn-dependent protease